MYINRAIDGLIVKYSKMFKAVLLTGARQVGKSTTLKHLAGERRYVTLDDPFVEDQAKTNTQLFMSLNKPPVTIDEVQHAPELFRQVKLVCDERQEERGLFYLSGSQPFHLMKGVSESLAGRVRILEMSTLSLREINGDGFDRHFLPTSDYVAARAQTFRRTENLWQIIQRGGYPGVQNPNVEWSAFYADYMKTYLERDVRALTAVHDLTAFRQFMTALAARTGEVLNYANIADEIGKDAGTVRAWVSVLEASGLVYLLQPYSTSELKRAIKAPKVYFRDTGLASYLTRWLTPEALACGAMAGHMFETFVVSEILKSYSNAGLDYRDFVSYYRGRDRRKVRIDGTEQEVEGEIDLILEENGTLHPVEIKLTGSPRVTDTAAFQVIDAVVGKKRGEGAVVCMCPTVGQLRDDVFLLPVECI